MLRRSVSVVALVLLALALGGAFAHVLELPNKVKLAADVWLIVQARLYDGWGNILGPVEFGALAACTALAALRRTDRVAFVCALLAALGIALALAIWIVFVLPSKIAVDRMADAGLSAEWQFVRNRWEYGHAARAVLFFASFVLLAVGATSPGHAERPNGAR